VDKFNACDRCPPLLYRPQPDPNSGFTLIEVLVSIIILSILAAIALPAFLSQARRAQQGEALTYVGAINRAQQAYRLDSRTFATSINQLGIGILEDTSFYQYSIVEGSSQVAIATANPQDDALTGYSGVVYVWIGPNGTATTTSKLCQGSRGGAPPLSVTVSNAAVDVVGCNDV
jgi:type IV pilus assembly protein PilA